MKLVKFFYLILILIFSSNTIFATDCFYEKLAESDPLKLEYEQLRAKQEAEIEKLQEIGISDAKLRQFINTHLNEQLELTKSHAKVIEERKIAFEDYTNLLAEKRKQFGSFDDDEYKELAFETLEETHNCDQFPIYCKELIKNITIEHLANDELIETIEAFMKNPAENFPLFFKTLRDLNQESELLTNIENLNKNLIALKHEGVAVDSSFDLFEILSSPRYSCNNWECFNLINQMAQKESISKVDLNNFLHELTLISNRKQEIKFFDDKIAGDYVNAFTELENLHYTSLPGISKIDKSGKLQTTQQRIIELEITREQLFHIYLGRDTELEIARYAQMHNIGELSVINGKARDLYLKGGIESLARSKDDDIKLIYKELNKIFKSQHGDYSRVLFTKPSQFENPMISRESSELFIDELAHHNRASFKGDHFQKMQDNAIKRLCNRNPDCIAKHQRSFDNFQYDEKLINPSGLEEKIAKAQNSGETGDKKPRTKCGHFQKLKPTAILKLSQIGMGHARYACVDTKTGAYEICDENGKWIREVSFLFTDIAKQTDTKINHNCI